MTTDEIEYAIYKFFVLNGGTYLTAVPRVHKKFKIHECDMLIVTKNQFLIEVEIKTSVSDCKADLDKEHEHKDNHSRLLYQYFAIPKSILEKCVKYIPKHFGILEIYDDVKSKDNSYFCQVYRPAELNRRARKITTGELISLLNIGVNHYWKFSKKVLDNEEES